jgi:small-conductance mechanosensitive channel
VSFVRVFRTVLVLVALAWPAFAEPEQTPRQRLDAARAALTEIDAALKGDNLADAELARLRAENDPVAVQLQAVIADLTPQLAASAKRLAELTPKTKETAATNDAASDELKAEQVKHDALDADLRSARALLLQSDDDATRIGAARRALFARETFARSSSLFSPLLWTGLARELPYDLGSVGGILRDWVQGLSQRMTTGQTLEFSALMLCVVGSMWPIRLIARRVITRDPTAKSPSRLRRALAAIWTILVLAGLPLMMLGVVAYALDAFDISDPRVQGGVDALLDGLRIVAAANALGRGMLAPSQPNWRLFDMSDRVAGVLFRFMLIAAAIWAVERLLEPAAEAVGSLNISVAARAVGAALIAVAAARALRSLVTPVPTPPAVRDSWAPARTLGWALTALLFGATLSGYIAFATFLVNKTMFMTAVGAALYLADILVWEGAEALLVPDAAIARSLMTTVGLRREALEQIVVLAQGFARLTAIAAALVFSLGPLGLPSQDLVSTLRAAYIGFAVGGVTISLSTLVGAGVLLMIGIVATRGAQNWLGERFLPRTRLDAGVRNSIQTIAGYIGVVLALLISGATLGVDLQKFAIVAGALSVGIGFGLQGIVNNFVAGLILLWERGIRVGDWVVVGAEQGFVRHINARATEIETFERATLIVPNSTLVTGAVKNWMYADRIARIVVGVNVAYGTDPEQAREILIAAAKAQKLVLGIPAPLVLFSEMGDWALKFQLICFVDEALMAERVKSELNFDVYQRMREAGLKTPFPFTLPTFVGP